MRLEVLCTGDELLNGTVSDTNSADFARILLDAGVEIARAVIVGDSAREITDAIREASARADALIICGGMGPTEDDLTAACVAQVAGVPLVLDGEALRRIEARFKAFGRPMTDNNRRQAMVPKGCTVLQSEVGTAPGLALRLGGARAWVMPGVPSEARWFCSTFVLPELKAQSAAVIKKVTLRCVGIGESDLDRRVKGMEAQFKSISLHFRTTFPENHLKLVCRGEDEKVVAQTLALAAAEAHTRLAGFVFSDDDRSFPAVLRDVLKARKQTVSTAESCTGGLLGKLLTDEPGSSSAYMGGVVAYSNQVKVDLLGVREETLARVGAVSAETAEEMAAGVRNRLKTDWGLSVTGIAGPDGATPGKPVGTIFVGLSGPPGTFHHKLSLIWDRDRNRTASAFHALQWLWELTR